MFRQDWENKQICVVLKILEGKFKNSLEEKVSGVKVSGVKVSRVKVSGEKVSGEKNVRGKISLGDSISGVRRSFSFIHKIRDIMIK